ncbi:hypothetical protein N7532_007823 [Penicillium argentinense]|uniref:Uncharacterized protein n=1 Tax=Penicillium argentinense TaxID=1131581 RepID=A0A9W9EWE5_9EURO|nr:uncharacterized protein N7532_007823 [Penicillium argentinense]KAJ5089139.1 hypothetical protein N7532_007823 [Penicillium argentinense]
MTTEYPRYLAAVALPVLSFIGIGLNITPLILHAKNRNIPAVSLISWYLLLNLFNIINALTWPTDDLESRWDGTGLCDIQVKMQVGALFAVPGALVGIFRGLAFVLDTSCATLIPGKTQRWRSHIMDLIFCIALPIVAMVLHVVWQKDRYLLYSISGCVINLDESWVSFALCFIWPPIICFVAAYYCCLILIRLRKYRSEFGMILHSSQSNLNKSRFFRLLLLGLGLLVCILPVEIFTFYLDLKGSLPWHPYSWAQLHGPGWPTITKVPTHGEVFFDRWSPPGAAFVIFGFFGFSHDATKIYRTMLWALGFGCFLPPTDSSNSTTLIGTTPSRAKLMFWKGKSSARTETKSSDGSDSQPSQSGIVDSSDRASSQSSPTTTPVKSWFPRWLLFNCRANCHNENTLLEDLPAAGNTVYTNAWAGTSVSRAGEEFESGSTPSPPVNKNFIHVKQVICQQSEFQI